MGDERYGVDKVRVKTYLAERALREIEQQLSDAPDNARVSLAIELSIHEGDENDE